MKQKKMGTNKSCVQKRFAHNVCTNGDVEWNTTGKKILADVKNEALLIREATRTARKAMVSFPAIRTILI
jgi:hypothetical protein